VAGIGLLILEMVVIPGFGVAGIGGIVLILWGLYELLLPDIPIGAEFESMALWGLIIGIIGGLIGLIMLFKLMTKTSFWQKLTSPGVEGAEAGYNTSVGWEGLIGKEGETQSDLRPSGWVMVNGQRVFVVSEGDFLEKNCKVRILSVDGNRVVVRKLNSEE
jgi:membrane-bound serine protease (ClpP class)